MMFHGDLTAAVSTDWQLRHVGRNCRLYGIALVRFDGFFYVRRVSRSEHNLDKIVSVTDC